MRKLSEAVFHITYEKGGTKMEEQLKNIFSNVNDWLKFAEAKNGVLTGFNGGAIFTVLSGFLFNKEMPIMTNVYVKAYFTCFAACASLALVIALMSFLAKVKIPWLSEGEIRPSDNLLFFADIHKYDEKAYLDALSEAVLNEEREEPYTRTEKFYANQIIVNSGIAMRKYVLFNAALWCTVAAVITPVLAFMLWVYIKSGD
ncbi:DUF5706 domain-containing protein [Desulfococcaceae bacterium HSG8]|nr:DUF5706 domain-containing protein [Desulfococcaceae bacterium HSG8]